MYRDGECYISDRAGSPYKTICLGGRYYQVHRIAYWLANGEDPGEMLVCHTCDTPACFNPEHLFLGTAQDNSNDKIAKNRQAFHPTFLLTDEGRRVRINEQAKNRPPRIYTPVNVDSRPGEGNTNNKLTEQQVLDMRAEHASGSSIRSLAKQYGVNGSVASRIINRKMWKHI